MEGEEPIRVLVLGAAGFIGATLVKSLRVPGSSLVIAGAERRPIGELVLADTRPVAPPTTASGPVIRVEQGDIRDAGFLERLLQRPYACIFHLAATLTLDAEMDFAQGMDVNVHALLRLLDRCRLHGNAPALVFASSISTFGGILPEVVDDQVVQTPETSYGAQKAVAELLVSDYSRRGFIDGRVLRLPVVLTHPGPATGSVSDHVAALIREPLNGRRAVCGLDPQVRFPVASARSVVRNLLALLALPVAAFGATRAMNLPSLTVTPSAIEEAVVRAAAARPGAGGIDWRRDDRLQSIAAGWPQVFTSQRALGFGISADATLDDVVAAYVEDARGIEGTPASA
jgi:nucleoside-diphosphate-sugar epimerase